jgi:hypothetical protein
VVDLTIKPRHIVSTVLWAGFEIKVQTLPFASRDQWILFNNAEKFTGAGLPNLMMMLVENA